ncbi:MAG: zf-HC2 domain-containing protein [Woeseia sp.]
MGKKMQMDDHGLIDRLLPWFVNDTLDGVEHDRVRRHLGTCEACRETVSLLSAVQSTVRHAGATPMVPPPRTERLLESIDSLDRKGRRLRPLAIMAIAASLAAALVVITLLLPNREHAVTEPARYETATAPARGASMDYVLDVQFERGTPIAAQERVLRGLEARDISRSEPDGMYRLTVNLPAASLEDLERFARDVESLSEIKSVRVIAVQLPMKRQQ